MQQQSTTNETSAKVESKTEIRRNRTAKGIKFVTLGAIIGFSSCVCSLCNPIESLYYINLYGIASIAILLAFYGLYLIFE